MRYPALTLAAAVVAVAIVGCKPQEAGQPQVLQPTRDFQAGEEPQVSDQPRANDDPPPGDQTQTNQGSGTDEEPLLLLDEEPPLLLDEEPPLLLDGGEKEFMPPTGPVADNSRCYVCHMSYMQEELAVVHARANIGCADCHGNCDEHIADESWAWGKNGTPPGIMYPPAKVNPFCMGCHPRDKIKSVHHKLFFAGTDEAKYCTDCHADHRLAERKCKWK